MEAVLVTARNPFDFSDRTIEKIDHPVRLVDLVPRDVPAIVCLNGEWRLRETWHETLRDGDHALVAVLPQGDRDIENLKTAATLAALYFATGGVGVAFGLTTWGAVAAGAAIAAGTSLALSALAGDPTRPGSGSPTYDQQASGNFARVNQEIPEQFGRLQFYPDIAAEAYVEPVGSANWFNQLFCLGQGEYEVNDADIMLGDEPLSSIAGMQKEIVGPGGLVTLFPRRVDTSTQVTEGAPQTLTYNVWAGPFAASPAGATIIPNRVALDILFPNGLATDDGTEWGADATVTVVAEARPIDALGNPTGAYAQIGTKTITANTRGAYRDTLDCTLSPAGRYEVRMERTSAPIGGYDDVQWVGMRAYTPQPDTYGNVTMLAVRMPAQTQVQSRSVNRLNVIATRKLPSWSALGGWTANASTRSIAAAIAQILRSSNGLGLPDARIDLAALWALDATWTARGDKFDFRFDSAVTPWDAVQAAARCGRTKAYLQGGVVRFARDEPKTVPAAMFTPRNILPNSLKLNYTFPTGDTPDCVIVEYFNEATWAWDEVLCQLVGETADRPARVKMQGISQHDHAWREGMYLAASMRYRRIQGELATEMEGFIPSCLDLIAVAHDRPRWGQAGEVTAWDAGTKTLTLSEPVTFVPSVTHYVGLRRRDGSLSGPYAASAGATAQQIVLTALPDITPDTDLTRERTHYAFGPSDAYRERLLCTAIQPSDSAHAKLQIVVEDDRVHSADQTTPPTPVDPWTLPRVPTMPTVTGLKVNQGGTPEQPVLFASWAPAAGADHYLVEISRDGTQYRRVGEPTTAHLDSINVTPGAIWLHVAAVGITQGPWSTPWNSTAGNVAAPPDVTGLALAETFVGPVSRIAWNPTPRATSYTVVVRVSGVVKRTRTVDKTAFEYTAEDAKQDGGPWRSFTFEVTANGSGSSATPATLAVNNPQAGVVTGITVLGTTAGLVIDWIPPAETDLKGYQVYISTTPGFTPGPSNLYYDGPDTFVHIAGSPQTTYYVKIAAYDVWDTNGLTYSAQYSSSLALITAANLAASISAIEIGSSLPSLGNYAGRVFFLTTDEKIYRYDGAAWTSSADGADLLANSVTAGKISVATLAAIAAELGSAVISTTGSLRSGQTAYNTGIGFWLGLVSGTPKFSIGNPSGDFLTWDGSNLSASGFIGPEGAWNPSVGGTATYTVQAGKWKRLGKAIFISGMMTINAIGTGSTGSISGLPATSSASEPRGVISIGYWGGLNGSYVYLTGLILTSDNKIIITGATAAAAGLSSYPVIAPFQSGSSVSFSGYYFVD